MGYLPIAEYGIIGDLHSVALIGTNGSIDWWCYPSFDSPSVFGALLDDAKGGRFAIEPIGSEIVHKQLYFPDTNVLITRFLSAEGVGEIVDFMPIRDAVRHEFHHLLVRKVEVVRGAVRFRVTCRPAFDYARAPHQTIIVPGGAVFESERLTLGCSTHVPLEATGPAAEAEFTLRAGERASFLLNEVRPGTRMLGEPSERAIALAFSSTVEFWRHWVSQSMYRGRWREMVNRSALALKLLTHAPTGALIAAPTTSLPELVGGARNWDYRYNWIRDASFTLYALMRIGFEGEARQFMKWISARLKDVNPDGSLYVVYSLDGKRAPEEQTLDHLEGYRGSKPVRIGNAAVHQLQLDIYGELLDAVYLYNKHGALIGYDLWIKLRRLLDYVAENWKRPDDGIWEVRRGQRHFVYSKVMCWVAMDRGLRIADKRGFPAPRERWIAARDEIYEQIMREGWSEDRQSFVQSYESDTLDAANLIMPLVFFLAPTDPRMTATLDAITRELVSDSLVYRYRHVDDVDGLRAEEGTFSMCTFWLVEALTRANRIDDARLVFDKMLTYANHLGLYAEEIGPRGEALGNFPQAFTHLALISAAYNLDAALSR